MAPHDPPSGRGRRIGDRLERFERPESQAGEPGEEHTPVTSLQPWSVDLDRLERRIDRRMAETHERQGMRIHGVEDELLTLRKETRSMADDLIGIQGRDGKGGAIASLATKIDGLIESQDKASAKHTAAQSEATRESAANRRTLLGIAVTLGLAIAGGVLLMRDRQTAIEHDVERQRDDVHAVKGQLDRIEGLILPRALAPLLPAAAPPPASPTP